MSVDPQSLVGHRRLVFASDIAGWGSLPSSLQKDAQGVLEQLLERSFDATEVRYEDVYREGGKGDSYIAVLPDGIREGRTVADIVRNVRNFIHRHNDLGRFPNPLRIRLAFGQGIIEGASNAGLSGSDVVAVCRALDAAATKQALRDTPAASMVVVLTEDLYRSTVLPQEYELRPADCTAVTVHERAGEEPAVGYLWLDERGGPPARCGRAERPVGPGRRRTVRSAGPPAGGADRAGAVRRHDRSGADRGPVRARMDGLTRLAHRRDRPPPRRRRRG